MNQLPPTCEEKKMDEGKDNQEVQELGLRLKKMDYNSGNSKKIMLERS